MKEGTNQKRKVSCFLFGWDFERWKMGLVGFTYKPNQGSGFSSINDIDFLFFL